MITNYIPEHKARIMKKSNSTEKNEARKVTLHGLKYFGSIQCRHGEREGDLH